MALTDNLVSYWKLDEASGDALDAAGTNDLTDHNSVGTGTGVINTARNFVPSSSQFLTHTSNADLVTGDIDFSLQAWVNLRSNSSTLGIVGRWISPNYEYLVYQSANRFRLAVYDGRSFGFLAADVFGTPPTGTWCHLIAWHDSINDQIGIAVNGGIPDLAIWTSGVSVATADFSIGHNQDAGDQYFDGLIDEVGFWKRVLTSAERASLYNGGAGFAYPFSGGGGGGGGGIIPQPYYPLLIGGIGCPF